MSIFILKMGKRCKQIQWLVQGQRLSSGIGANLSRVPSPASGRYLSRYYRHILNKCMTIYNTYSLLWPPKTNFVIFGFICQCQLVFSNIQPQINAGKCQKSFTKTYRCSSVVQHLPSMHKALGLLSSTAKQNKTSPSPKVLKWSFSKESNCHNLVAIDIDLLPSQSLIFLGCEYKATFDFIIKQDFEIQMHRPSKEARPPLPGKPWLPFCHLFFLKVWAIHKNVWTPCFVQYSYRCKVQSTTIQVAIRNVQA